jgi:hypothetical protein
MKNKILLTISFLAALLVISSCLKDDVGEDWTDSLKGKMYAEVWNGGYRAFSLQPVAEPDTFKFMVNIASDQPPAEDITLTLEVNGEAMTRYNTLKGTDYKLFPFITILNPTVVIKAGTRNAYVHVKVWNANTLSACDNFMAPISIKTATGGVIVADPVNQGSRLMALPIANQYQGNYHAVGYFFHPTSPRAIDQDKSLSTLTCKSVRGDYADLGPDYTMDLIVDESQVVMVGTKPTYKVTILCYGPLVFEQLDVADDLITHATGVTWNYWDINAKAFVLRSRYNNGAAWREAQEVVTKY